MAHRSGHGSLHIRPELLEHRLELAVEFLACVDGLPGITEQFHNVLRSQWLIVGANLRIVCAILIVVRHYATVIAHARHHGTIQPCMGVIVHTHV